LLSAGCVTCTLDALWPGVWPAAAAIEPHSSRVIPNAASPAANFVADSMNRRRSCMSRSLIFI
jgi:hypothetical protein